MILYEVKKFISCSIHLQVTDSDSASKLHINLKVYVK